MITFKNKPDTTTPINAENLNANFNEAKKAIDDLNSVVELYSGDITETGVYALNDNYSNYRYLVIYGTNVTASQRNVVSAPGYKVINDASNYVQFFIAGNLTLQFNIRYSGTTNKNISISEINNVHIRRIVGIK